MKWANFLHIYQPVNQQADILEAIVNQCYRPIFNYLSRNFKGRITINVTGALLELFEKHGYTDLIDALRLAGKEGKVELTGSAKYHAFLPLIETEDIIRQIKINEETNSFYLREAYQPRGFFAPEMAFNEKVLSAIETFPYDWVILDELALRGRPDQVDYTKIYRIKNSKLKVFFRERRLSNLIMSAVVRSKESLRAALHDDLKSGRYIITAMDGETFGHHRPGLEQTLFDIFEMSELELVAISDLLSQGYEEREAELVPCTWASSQEDIQKGIQFLSWRDPDNVIHEWQWELFYLVKKWAGKISSADSNYSQIKKLMDIGMASDQYWWASAKPWWSLEMIESGAFSLLDTLRKISRVPAKDLQRAAKLYELIVSTAFSWQRTGKIRQMSREQNALLRIPFKDRTLGKGGEEAGVYRAFIDMMKDLEKKAATKQEYEQAILWRDAVIKLDKKSDIYDAVNAIDLLRTRIPNKQVEETIARYKKSYRRLRGGQPEQRGS
jgi:hypothetical protein